VAAAPGAQLADGVFVVHGSLLVTEKPAGERAHTTVCKISLACVSEFCEGGIVDVATISPVFLRARPFGGFFYLGFMVPLKLTYGGRESSAM
jgi:hypothetical protein